VNPESYFQLLSPALFMGVAGVFYKIARDRPEHATAYFFAISYCFGAIGFLADFARFAVPNTLCSVVSNIAYLTASISFAVGLLKRAGRPVPVRLISVAAALNIIGFCYLKFVYDDLWTRTLWLHFHNGVIFSIGLAYAWTSFTRKIDKLLGISSFIFCAQFFVRPVIADLLSMMPESMDVYAESSFLLLLHLVVGASALAVAATLLAAYVLDILQNYKTDAITDKLTNIYNRRGLETRFGDMRSSLKPDARPLFLIMADIDRFKWVNDTHGHAFGDQVIRGFGDLLLEAAGDEGIAARIGGEEFALIISANNLDAAYRRAEALRAAFAAVNFPIESGYISLTTSLGISQYIEGQSLPELLEKADGALYHAKQNGRNRTATELDTAIGALKNIAEAETPDKANIKSA